MKLAHSLLVLGIIGVAATWGVSSDETATSQAAVHWESLGRGNLEAVQTDSTWALHTVPATYIDMLGVIGKKQELLSPAVYELSENGTPTSIPKPVSSQVIGAKTPTGKSIRLLQASNHVYNAVGEHTSQLADGRLLFDDPEQGNLWLVDPAGKVEPLLDTAGLDETKKLAASFGSLGEETGNVEWASSPMIAGKGDAVLFYSNRDTVKDKFFGASVYAVSLADRHPRLIFDTRHYKQSIQLINAVGNTVVGYLPATNTVLLHDLAGSTTKELALGGYPTALSPDGHTLLYRKVVNHQVQRDFYLMDIRTGLESRVQMTQDFFFNQIGAWSPDGTRFAFYLNGLSNNDPTKHYRTNVKIGVVDVRTSGIEVYDKPATAAGTLYPLGSISWLGNDQVVAYTTDDRSWALTIN